jgi:hypothetical protein
MSDSLTIKNEVDMINIENKVDAEKLINSIKNLKNGRVAKFVKMYICDGMNGDEIVSQSYANPSELGNMHKYGKDYLINGVCYETVMNDIKLGITKMKEYAYG